MKVMHELIALTIQWLWVIKITNEMTDRLNSWGSNLVLLWSSYSCVKTSATSVSLLHLYSSAREKNKSHKPCFAWQNGNETQDIIQERSLLTFLLIWHLACMRMNNLSYWNTWSKNWIAEQKSCNASFQTYIDWSLYLHLGCLTETLIYTYSFYRQMKKHWKDKMKNITPDLRGTVRSWGL